MSTPTKSSAKHTAMHGSFWTLGGYGASQVVRLVSSLILARLLFPEAFGLMALVNVFMQGLEMLSDIGLGPSIIQSPRGAEPRFLRTAWTMQILRGAMLWLAACVLAHPAAVFFSTRDPSASQLANLLPVAGLMALFGGLSSTSVYTLNRKMAMRRLTVLALAPQAVTLVVSVSWAVFHRSVWAIVGGGLGGSLVRLFLSHRLNDGPRDRLGWDRDAARELERFGRWVFLSTVVSFLASNLDRVLLGRLLTLGELGLYSIGMTFARVATQVSTRLTNTVVFPLLAKYRDNPARLLVFAARARAAVLWAGGAICAGFAIFAPTFFAVLYDERYGGAGRISQWLALYIWIWILNATIDRIPLALGRPRALFSANVASAFGMVLAWSGYQIAGLPGFITGMALAQVAAHVCLELTIPGSRTSLMPQSLVASFLVAAYTLAALAVLKVIDPQLPPWGSAAAHGFFAALPLAMAALVVRRMMGTVSTPPELMQLAGDVSARRVEVEVLRERGTDVLIARTQGPNGSSVIVKLWNRRGFRGLVRRLTHTQISRSEFEMLRRLRAHGALVPEPYARVDLRDPAARHTEALIEEDMGRCGDATERIKHLIRVGDEEGLRRFEDELIEATAVMLRAGIVDADHRLPNFVTLSSGRPVRLDFEIAMRAARSPRRARHIGVMVGTLIGTHAFAVQPNTILTKGFARRLTARLNLTAQAFAAVRSTVESMLERQRMETGIDTHVDLEWTRT